MWLEQTKFFRNVKNLNKTHLLLLTGTAVHNTLRELWGMLNLLHADIFTTGSGAIFDR